MKIIINIQGKIKPRDALEKVMQVIDGGLASQTWKHKIKHYCWATKFSDKTVVFVKQRKTHNSAHSFLVIK